MDYRTVRAACQTLGITDEPNGIAGTTIHVRSKIIRTAGNTVSDTGRTIRNVGKTVSKRGKTVSNPGKSVSNAGETVCNAGKTISRDRKTVSSFLNLDYRWTNLVSKARQSLSNWTNPVSKGPKTVSSLSRPFSNDRKSVSNWSNPVSNPCETVSNTTNSVSKGQNSCKFGQKPHRVVSKIAGGKGVRTAANAVGGEERIGSPRSLRAPQLNLRHRPLLHLQPAPLQRQFPPVKPLQPRKLTMQHRKLAFHPRRPSLLIHQYFDQISRTAEAIV